MTTAITPTHNADLPAILDDIAGQLAPNSRRAYVADTTHFVTWLERQGFGITDVTRSILINYRRHLADDPQDTGKPYSRNTAARMLASARRICQEAHERGLLADDPTRNVRGFKSGRQETTHRALLPAEARALLNGISRNDAKGKRDYALLLLLLKTGMRRSEVAALTIGDVRAEQGHHTATIQHGKGDVRRVVKIAGEVRRALDEYLDAAGRAAAPAAAPLFVQFRKGDHPTERPLAGDAVAEIVKAYATAANLEGLSPHGLRASFVTLALEGGAKLQQVQYAAGHADPRTTERYQKRKLNLDDAATDYVRF